MSEDSLENAAEQAITDSASLHALKEVKKEIKAKYDKITKKELEFIMEFMISGKAYRSYQKVFNPKMSMTAASTSAHKLLKRIDVSFIDFLEYAGHGQDKIAEALDKLYDKDVDRYLHHVTKLKQLDVTKIQHSGSINIPNITIVTTDD